MTVLLSLFALYLSVIFSPRCLITLQLNNNQLFCVLIPCILSLSEVHVRKEPSCQVTHTFPIVSNCLVLLLLKVNIWRDFKGHTSYRMAHSRLMQQCNISMFNVSFKVCCNVKESSGSLFSYNNN